LHEFLGHGMHAPTEVEPTAVLAHRTHNYLCIKL